MLVPCRPKTRPQRKYSCAGSRENVARPASPHPMAKLFHLSKPSFDKPKQSFINALDECDDDNSIAKFMQLLARTSSLPGISSSMRIFLTSKPEITIRC